MAALENGLPCPACGCQTTAPSPESLPAGMILHEHYYLGEPLGKGGFGITYLARDLVLDRLVAIKEYFPSFIARRAAGSAADVTVFDRATEIDDPLNSFEHGKDGFLSEARTLARFGGTPGIVDVLDFFAENGTAYIVMDYIEGASLRDCIRTHGPMDAETLIERFEPLLGVLGKVHQTGVIHRDISPDNIMVSKDGLLTLMDFGAAREMAVTAPVTMLTKEGYSPIEQYGGTEQLGPWSDIYSLGATWLYCLSGKTPPSSASRMASDELDVAHTVGGGSPAGFADVLRRMVALVPKDRYQSVDALQQALGTLPRAVLADPVTRARDVRQEARQEEAALQPARPLTRRAALVGAGALAIAGAAYALTRGLGDTSEGEAAPAGSAEERDGVYHVKLYSPNNMTIEDFRRAKTMVQERLDAFFDGGAYGYSEENGRLLLELPKEAFTEDLTVQDFANLYLANYNYLHICPSRNDLGSVSERIALPREEIESVELVEPAAADDASYHVIIKLRDGFVQNNAELLSALSDEPYLVFDLFGNYNAWSFARSGADGSLDIELTSSPGLARLLRTMLEQDALEAALHVEVSVLDEIGYRPKDAAFADGFAVVRYAASQASAGEKLDTITALTSRLSTYGVPAEIHDAHDETSNRDSLHVFVPLDRWATFLPELLICKEGFFVQWGSTGRAGLPGFACKKIAGEGRSNLHVSSGEQTSVEEIAGQLSSPDEVLTLFFRTYPLMYGRVVSDGAGEAAIAFDEWVFDSDGKADLLLELLLAIQEDGSIPYAFYEDGWNVLDADGAFRSSYDSAFDYSEKLDRGYISAIESLGDGINCWVDDDRQLCVTASYDVSSELPETCYSLIKGVIEAIDYARSPYKSLVVVPIEETQSLGERCRIIVQHEAFYNVPAGDGVRVAGIVANGRLVPYIDAFKELVGTTAFFSQHTEKDNPLDEWSWAW